MGWGGARPGSGPKPRPKPEKPVNPFELVHGGKKLADGLVPHLETPSDQALQEPPADLPQLEQEFWRVHAPLAIERRTLTKATASAFRLLCELHAKKVMVGGMVDKGALGGLRIFLQLSKQVEMSMARFCLAPFGKPLVAEKPKAIVNPWQQMASK